jgi:Fe-S-cluster containining protein
MSAIVTDDGGGHCPALVGNLCTIYDARPLTCRTVPMHYSRPPSALRTYLDTFAATPGYACDTTPGAPIVLDGNRILDPIVRQHRDDAIAMAKGERAWKEHILRAMDDAERARAARLPTYDAVFANSDNGYATLLPMIVAWRIAQTHGLLSVEAFADLCRKQAALIGAEIGRNPEGAASTDLREALSLYRFELSAASRGEPAAAFPTGPLHR